MPLTELIPHEPTIAQHGVDEENIPLTGITVGPSNLSPGLSQTLLDVQYL